jgi:hypothetical protein
VKYQLFPNLTADEMEALTADIKERGVMVPVEVDENGEILDGHHRVMIADSLGIEYPTVVRSGWTEDQKLVHVVALNAHRRQLTATERSEVVATLRKAKLSTRAIAKAVGVGPTTVRRDLSNAPSGAMPERIETTDGRTYPAARPRLDPAPDPILAKRAAAKAEPTPDYIDMMPPALQAEELDFRKRGKWSKQIHAATGALLAVHPHEVVPTLSAEERESTERSIELIEEWIAKTRTELAKGAPLRLVGGKA